MRCVSVPLALNGSAPLLRRGVSCSSWQPSAIDLSGLAWATPFDVAAIAATWSRLSLSGRRPDLIVPADPTVRAYLVDMGLSAVVPAEWGSGGGCAVDPPWLPLTHVASADAWDDLQGELWPTAAEALGDITLTRRTLEILGELVDNAATHGVSTTGTFVCAQRYTGSTSGLPPGVWLGVADAGVGVPDHLRRNPRYGAVARDADLIVLARRQWVTGTADRRGWGLVEVFEAAAASGPSQILIRSGGGEGDFRLRPGGRPYVRKADIDPKVPGTWIHVRVEGA